MKEPRSTEPTWAERARTLLAVARPGHLHTGCRWSAPAVTPVEVVVEDGTLVVRMSDDAAAVSGLGACRVGTLTVDAPGEVWSLRAVASFRMERPDDSGLRTYSPIVLSMRATGPTEVTINVDAFSRAQPDVLRTIAPSLLTHLESAHAGELLAMARAHEGDAETVTVRSLDRHGLELAVLGPQGMGRLRMNFACGPLHDVSDLADALASLQPAEPVRRERRHVL
ncbi:DUF2470 domain-containing protein [Aeromicrobium sp. CF3.5]|uniref:DUF2470 domain-containing protein n=1 Tax=Aeromicrobium sp. CF3.5 TaxID=3373078 RepID=UPI003EE6A33E